MKEQGQLSKCALEAPINPKNPLNVNDNINVDINEKEKDNVYVDVKENTNDKDKEKGNDYVKENVGENTDSFMNSLILNDDFDSEEEHYSYEEGTISDYMQSLYLQEEERKYRQSQGLEEDRELYI